MGDFFPLALGERPFSSPEESSPNSGRISGASSRSACPVFLMALASPISNHKPVSRSSFRKRPGGSIPRMSLTMAAAIWAFSSFLVVGARYSFLRLLMTSRNLMLPLCELIRPPRPGNTKKSRKAKISQSSTVQQNTSPACSLSLFFIVDIVTYHTRHHFRLDRRSVQFPLEEYSERDVVAPSICGPW